MKGESARSSFATAEINPKKLTYLEVQRRFFFGSLWLALRSGFLGYGKIVFDAVHVMSLPSA